MAAILCSTLSLKGRVLFFLGARHAYFAMIDSKIILKLAICLCGIAACESVSAADLQEATLSANTGAIDQYQVTCPVGTDHLKIQAARSVMPDATLQQNLRVAKGGDVANSVPVTPGMTAEVSVQAGNGKYAVTIDTNGSAAGSKQVFSAGFQCLNASGQAVRTSLTGSTGGIKKKAKKLSVTCAKTKAGGNAQSLLVQLTNTTKGTPVLISQAVKSGAATSVPESLPGELARGAGDYQVLVAHNGTPAPADFQYALQSSCLDGSDVDVGTPIVTLLQSSLPR